MVNSGCPQLKLFKRWAKNKMKKSCRPSSTSFLTFIVCLLLLGLMTMSMPHTLLHYLTSRSAETASVWLFRSQDGMQEVPVRQEKPATLYPSLDDFDESTSPYMLPPGSDKTGTIYTKKKPERSSKVYTIGYYDPEGELQFFGKKGFDECEYDKCRMTQEPATADAIIFYVVKLKNSPTPTFRRKPGQIWILKTEEAPARFSWFKSLNRTGIRSQINWTMTHKLDSDIPILYGRLMKNELYTEKNYDKIYESKNRTAALFVSHCPVRSDRLMFVERMKKRIDVDVFGVCGNLTCGQGEKIAGVVGMRIAADKEFCFPLLTNTYKFYLAFENSLCQEYITEKYFKIYEDVDIVPVVRGGADYKSYFPPGTFVDASDFSKPEDLADFLDDLGNDKDRYNFYLRNKNRYRVVWDFPEWHCKLCEKLHTDHQVKTYKNIHQWFTQNSCVDPKDLV